MIYVNKYVIIKLYMHEFVILNNDKALPNKQVNSRYVKLIWSFLYSFSYMTPLQWKTSHNAQAVDSVEIFSVGFRTTSLWRNVRRGITQSHNLFRPLPADQAVERTPLATSGSKRGGCFILHLTLLSLLPSVPRKGTFKVSGYLACCFYMFFLIKRNHTMLPFPPFF